jgi:hypothetical protein
MHALVRAVFSRLHTLDSALEEERLQTNSREDDPQDGDLKMTVSPDQVSVDGKPPNVNQIDASVQSDAPKALSSQGEITTPSRKPHCNVVSF